MACGPPTAIFCSGKLLLIKEASFPAQTISSVKAVIPTRIGFRLLRQSTTSSTVLWGRRRSMI